MSNLKIGDKIKIQKEEKNKELEDTFNDILLALKTNKLNQSEKLKWCGTALEILELWFKEDELKSVKVAKRKLIPILEELAKICISRSSAPLFSFLLFAKISSLFII